MKMNTVDLGKTNVNKTKTGSMPRILLVLLLSVLFSAGGCGGYYTAYPGYGPYYGGPYYGNPGSVTIAVGDRPYYVRGPGYWYGGAYYVWRPGRWVWRHGQQVWIHGHYVVRGY
jgi:WXXGXW repeat (2 copies)